MRDSVFITGVTGYMGSRLAALLVGRGYRVYGLTRAESRHKLPPGVEGVIGNALDPRSYLDRAPRNCTFIHLVGTPHPAPWKARRFVEVDLGSLKASVAAAKLLQVQHFVFVSVAHPAPTMRAYIQVRKQCEAILETSGLKRTILRPWYVLGPGHRWPVLLKPLYKLAERFQVTRAGALRLGLVTIDEMVGALSMSVDAPADSVCRIVDVPGIQKLGGGMAISSAFRAAAPAAPDGGAAVRATAGE